MLRIISLNLNGIRAAWRKNVLPWLEESHADVICFQEVRAQTSDLTEEMRNPPGYHTAYFPAEKKGYSGVGLWSKVPPLRVTLGFGVEEFDAQGRCLQADFADFSVISLYLPSGSASPERQASKFRFLEVFLPYLQRLPKDRDIVVCGDFNIAHHKIDLKNWRGNQENSGFLPEERAWMDHLFAKGDWVDVYRNLYPERGEEGYTWWSNFGKARANNAGWRIDYQIATPAFAARATDAAVYKEQWFSDHAPLSIDYRVP